MRKSFSRIIVRASSYESFWNLIGFRTGKIDEELRKREDDEDELDVWVGLQNLIPLCLCDPHN